MTTQIGPMAETTRCRLPNDRDLAFALTIVKSKPAELAISEYLALLRQHIAKGRRENALSAVYRHLDRSAYWRAEHDRIKSQLKAAEDAKTDAMRETEALKKRLEELKAGGSSTAKKRRADPDIVSYPRSAKRARRAGSPDRSVSGMESPFDADVELDNSDASSKS